MQSLVHGKLTQYSFNGNFPCLSSCSGKTDDVPSISNAGSPRRGEATASVSDPSSSEPSVTAQLDKNCEEKSVEQWRKWPLHNQRVVWLPQQCIWMSTCGCRWWKCVWDDCIVSCLPYYCKYVFVKNILTCCYGLGKVAMFLSFTSLSDQLPVPLAPPVRIERLYRIVYSWLFKLISMTTLFFHNTLILNNSLSEAVFCGPLACDSFVFNFFPI